MACKQIAGFSHITFWLTNLCFALFQGGAFLLQGLVNVASRKDGGSANAALQMLPAEEVLQQKEGSVGRPSPSKQSHLWKQHPVNIQIGCLRQAQLNQDGCMCRPQKLLTSMVQGPTGSLVMLNCNS